VSSSSGPFRLESKRVPRPWGGEIWFSPRQGELPLLVKFIYTHQALSYQVHPDDEYAARRHNCRGKTEMWYVARAEPDAKIGLGFNRAVTKDYLREAARSGAMESLLNWVSPRRGETYFTPAGTIHAIGAGVQLWEVQENSDITYRLFDYGRGRELHLDDGLNVISTAPFKAAPVPLPLRTPWFCVDKLDASAEAFTYRPHAEKYHLIICVTGEGSIAGEPFRSGEVWMVPAASPPFDLKRSPGAELLRAAGPA
jgi:mannose-6-phosphate isomerase